MDTFSLLLAAPPPPPPKKNVHTDVENLKACRVFYLCVKNLFEHILYITQYNRGFKKCFPGFAPAVSKPLKYKKKTLKTNVCIHVVIKKINPLPKRKEKLFGGRW